MQNRHERFDHFEHTHGRQKQTITDTVFNRSSVVFVKQLECKAIFKKKMINITKPRTLDLVSLN